MKIFIKRVLGFFRCLIAGVEYPGDVYVGRHVHFVNGTKIELGKHVQIRPDVDLFAGEVFRLGTGCDIGTRNRIVGNVIIGDYVLFGPDNYICSEDHKYRDISCPIMFQGTSAIHRNGHSELKIGEGSWIWTHVAIIGDVHIGCHCIVGANSVILKDVPDYCVVAGNPARIIRQYNFKTGEWDKND